MSYPHGGGGGLSTLLTSAHGTRHPDRVTLSEKKNNKRGGHARRFK
jgi:hypothetical protein